MIQSAPMPKPSCHQELSTLKQAARGRVQTGVATAAPLASMRPGLLHQAGPLCCWMGACCSLLMHLRLMKHSLFLACSVLRVRLWDLLELGVIKLGQPWPKQIVLQYLGLMVGGVLQAQQLADNCGSPFLERTQLTPLEEGYVLVRRLMLCCTPSALR